MQKMIKFQLVIEQEVFFCHLSKKPRKNINVRIKNDNQIFISKPKHISLDAIKNYLLSNKEWIIEKSLKINALSQKRADFISSEKVVIFNETYNIDNLAIDTDITAYLNETLHAKIGLLRPNLDLIINSYNLNSPKILVKKMQGKWGSCYIHKNIIYINQKLVHYPINCLQYVMLHEYMHFIEANHSKDFYSLIKTHMPNYKLAIKYLKEN